MHQNQAQQRYHTLMSYLEQDPQNPNLLADTAAAALAAHEVSSSDELFGQLATLRVLSDDECNLAGLAAMRAGNLAQAKHQFQALLDKHPGDANVRFNLAWSHALAGETEASLELLDDEVTLALPQAAALDIQLRHGAGAFEEAGNRATHYLSVHTDYAPLNAAISVLAMDIEDEELARSCAQSSANHPDGLTTLATLTLGEQKTTEAKAMFEEALQLNSQSPRAWIGLGLTNLSDGDKVAAAAQLDKGAALFEDHLGSWIAAGWAHFLNGDMAAARNRFQTALDLDDNFAECHGSLAVLDFVEGKSEEGARRLKIAQRLDRSAFSAAFAHILSAAGEGDEAMSAKIFEKVVSQPIDAQGRTIASIIAAMTKSPH